MPEAKAAAAAATAQQPPSASSPDRKKKEGVLASLAGAGAASHTKNNNSTTSTKTKANNNNNNTSTPREYNPLWKGYLYIVLSSLISLSSISNARSSNDFYKGSYGVGLLFATVTFCLGLMILILDRTKWLSSSSSSSSSKDKTSSSSCRFDFTKTFDGKLEGYTLLVWTFWWIVGVAYITQVNGMAYVASNIYFSAWMCLASCIYTLNEWSTNKVSVS
jgi:hypothetical protein